MKPTHQRIKEYVKLVYGHEDSNRIKRIERMARFIAS
jgi:hypothetical protein